MRGLSLQATNTPLKAGGFAAGAYDGALSLEWCRECVLERLDVAAVGGQAIRAIELANSQIRDNHIHDTGACGIWSTGTDSMVTRNHVHHVGRYHPSAVALWATNEVRPGVEKGLHVYRNEVHDTPYSGIIVGGRDHLIEENLIYRVMRELQDGAAIYCGGRTHNTILRGNVVRDVVKMGEGYGVSSYYLDEGSHDSIVERNVSIGVERPTHNHVARNLIIRDNVFIANADMCCRSSCGELFVYGKHVVRAGQINIMRLGAIPSSGRISSRDPPSAPIGQPQASRRCRTFAPPFGPERPPLHLSKRWPATPSSMANSAGRHGGGHVSRGACRPAASEWFPHLRTSLGRPRFCRMLPRNVAMFRASAFARVRCGARTTALKLDRKRRTTYVFRGFADGTLQSVTVPAPRPMPLRRLAQRCGSWPSRMEPRRVDGAASGRSRSMRLEQKPSPEQNCASTSLCTVLRIRSCGSSKERSPSPGKWTRPPRCSSSNGMLVR